MTMNFKDIAAVEEHKIIILLSCNRDLWHSVKCQRFYECVSDSHSLKLT